MPAFLLVLLLAVVAPAWAQERPCPDERDQLRILSRMLGDGRGQAELSLAEALRRLGAAEAEVLRLKTAITNLEKKAGGDEK